MSKSFAVGVRAGAATVAAAILAACGAATTLAPASGPLNLARPPASKAQHVIGPRGLYVVAGKNDDTVNVYRLPDQKNRGPACYVTPSFRAGSVEDIGIDPQGHLWFPQGAASGATVTEYGARCGGSGRGAQLLKTLNDPYGQPQGVAFDKSGTVYVSNITGVGSCYSSFCAGNIVIYPRARNKPSNILEPPDRSTEPYVYGDAVDGNGDVYMSFGHPASSQIAEFPAGSTTPKTLSLPGLYFPIGITFDKNQNLVAVDYDTSTVDVFAPPYDAAPIYTISLRGDAGYLALNERNNVLYLASSQVGGVEAYAYPTGTYLYTITAAFGSNGPGGLAVDPAGN
jgi:DNA-binding beta-propeller fold protein YncE